MIDSSLISECIRGDSTAQKEFYSALAPRIYTLCRRFAKENHQAKDHLQDCFEKIFQKLDKIPEDCRNIEGWIYTVARNFLVNKVQKKQLSFKELHLESIVIESIIDYEETGSKESAELAVNLLQELPEKYRNIINLYFIEGYTHQEIALMLSIKDSSSRSQLSRALGKLRESFFHSQTQLGYDQTWTS